MSIAKVSTEEFKALIAKEDATVIADFYADWCGPCRMVGPVVEELSGEFADYEFCKVNVDESDTLAQEYSVMSIPTIIKFEKGEVSARVLGYRSKEDLAEELEL